MMQYWCVWQVIHCQIFHLLHLVLINYGIQCNSIKEEEGFANRTIHLLLFIKWDYCLCASALSK
jgi:hypothetical protein